MKKLIDIHTHSIVSGHAYSTLAENVKEGKAKGLKYIGISDHAPAMPGGPHLYYFSNLKVIPNYIDDIRILKGCEANIINFHGEIDITEREISGLDYIIASLHPPCIDSGTVEENTNAVIRAMQIPKVKVIGHPDDSRYPLDYKKLVQEAIKNGVLLEINNSSLGPASFRENAHENVLNLLKECKVQGAKIIMGSDAHYSLDVGNFVNCEKILKEAGFPDNLIVNYNEEDIKKYILD